MAGPNVARPRCTYWDKCYRKNADHRKNLLHPGDDDDNDKTVDDVKDDTADDVKNTNRALGARLDLRRKRVLFAGTFTNRNGLQMLARAKMFGCVIQTSLGRDTDAVVCGEGPGKVAEDAKVKGVKIYSEEEWDAILAKRSGMRY